MTPFDMQLITRSILLISDSCWLCMQAQQLTKHLQLEQQKAEKDRTNWERKEAELQHSLQETLSSSQRLQDAKETMEQEHSSLQELHKQLMAELQQRNGQGSQVQNPVAC